MVCVNWRLIGYVSALWIFCYDFSSNRSSCCCLIVLKYKHKRTCRFFLICYNILSLRNIKWFLFALASHTQFNPFARVRCQIIFVLFWKVSNLYFYFIFFFRWHINYYSLLLVVTGWWKCFYKYFHSERSHVKNLVKLLSNKNTYEKRKSTKLSCNLWQTADNFDDPFRKKQNKKKNTLQTHTINIISYRASEYVLLTQKIQKKMKRVFQSGICK